MSDQIKLIVGLGNPGAEYAQTRHNVGFWWVDDLVSQSTASWRRESKFHGELARLDQPGKDVLILKPSTFMNRSGLSLAACARYYKIPASAILVVHDELDLSPGTLRLKLGGGHGGHNGLRDIHQQLGSDQYARLRIGIGHPGVARDVTGYVLGRPSAADREVILVALEGVATQLELLIGGKMEIVMNELHRRLTNKTGEENTGGI